MTDAPPQNIQRILNARKGLMQALDLLRFLSDMSPVFRAGPNPGPPSRFDGYLYAKNPDQSLSDLINSIHYRFGALHFQITVLNERIAMFNQPGKPTPTSPLFNQYKADYYLTLLYTLDNCVFNAFSICDYFGMALMKTFFKQIWITLNGEPTDRRRISEKEYDWATMHSLFSGKINGYGIKRQFEPVIKKIIEHNGNFASRLAAYRNRIIHREAPQSEIEYDPATGEMKIFAPKEFVNEVGVTDRQPSQSLDKVPLMQALENMIDRTCNAIIDISTEIQKVYMSGTLGL